MNKRTITFNIIVFDFIFLFVCQSDLYCMFDAQCKPFEKSKLFKREFAAKGGLRRMLDRLFVCKQHKSCSCRFEEFVASINKFSPYVVKIMQLEEDNYLDRLKIICTINCDILKDYVLKIRIPSENPSRIVAEGDIVREGVEKKINLTRLVGAKCVSQCITRYGMRHVIVPKKYLYHIPGRSVNLTDGNYIVVSRLVPGITLENYLSICKKNNQRCWFTQEVADEIYTCVKESVIFNPDAKNIIVTPDCKFALIDTECLPCGPDWYETLCRSFAFQMAHYSYPKDIKNPYIKNKILTKKIFIDAMEQQQAFLKKRHRLKMPYENGVVIFDK